MKGIYLGACRAYHPNYNLDYNDIVEGYHINVVGDMMNIDLTKYDYIIATPPCNYYSRCNYRRNISEYSLKTKHLLPDIIKKCALISKPFIIENVRNDNIFKNEGIYKLCDELGVLTYVYGRHTYFTNVFINFNNIKQRQDFLNGGYRIKYNDDFSKYNQGGYNVHNVIEYWLKVVNN